MKYRPGKAYSFPLKNNYRYFLVTLVVITIFCGFGTAFAQENQPVNQKSLAELKNGGVLQANIIPLNPHAESKKKFYYEMKPGDTITDRFWLSNSSEKDNSLKIYPAHTIIGENGTEGFSIPGEDEAMEISKWIILENSQFQLKPKENRQIEFIISIPPETPYGLYKGGFAMEKFLPAKEGEMLNTSFRKVNGIEINITENPRQFNTVSTNAFQPPVYFWPALILFVFSVTFYYVSKRHDRQKKNYTK